MSNRKKTASIVAQKAERNMEKTEVPSLQETAEKTAYLYQAASKAQQ